MGAVVIWAGSKAKSLKNALQLSDQATISSGATDPSLVALSGVAGDAYLSTTTFKLYIKQDAGTSTNWARSGSLVGLTPGSVPFINASGNLIDDNTKFFWDDATKRLGIGNGAPTEALDVTGNGKFSGSLSSSSVKSDSLDRATAGTLAIGGTNSTIINIGNAGATINIQGTTNYENVDQLQVKDPLVTINKGGGVGSAANSGIELEENSVITGYVETSADRNSWNLKAPNSAGIATITPGAGGITIAGSISGTSSGTNTGDVTIGTFGASPDTKGATISGQTLTLQPADASHPGAITSTDWSTFNAKEPAVTATTSADYYRGDKTFQPLNNTAVKLTNIVGSPVVTNSEQYRTHVGSSGITDGAEITDNGDGTVNVSAASCFIRPSISVTSITRVSTTATVTTSVNHGYMTDDAVYIRGANETAYNGRQIITATGLNTFTYSVYGSPATPVTGSIFSFAEHGTLYSSTVTAATNLALTDHFTNYVFVDWNGGAPNYQVTTDPTTVLGIARTNAWTIAREGTKLWLVDNRASVCDSENKNDTRDHEVDPFRHVVGGTNLTASGTRNIALTSGSFWDGLNRINHPQFDTSGSDTFTTVYTPDSGSTWTYTAGQTQISNTQYNNIASGLASITVGNYGVFWVYIMNNNPGTLMVLYGQGDYTKSQAFASEEPLVKPNIVSGIGALVGRIIIKQGASSFTNITSSFIKQFPNTAPDLDSLADVAAPSPSLNDVLSWNGTNWVNSVATPVSAGAAVNFYNATPTVIATGTNNANQLLTLSSVPVTTTEQTIVTPVNNTTLFNSAWTFGSALNRTQLDAGTWEFTIYAGVLNTGATRTITKNIYQIIPGATGSYTLTTTGTLGTRTATVTGASFLAGDASATITVGGYLQTPQGLYKISAFSSSTSVTIITPTTYVNETGVQFSNWRNLFGGTTATISTVSPNYSPMTITSTQPTFPIAVTDTLGTVLFVTSNNNTSITTVYNGTSHNSFAKTPLVTDHDVLAGLQGGSAGQYYHLTQAEYAGTGVGTGNVARLSSPTFTTPNIGNATGNISGTAANATNVATTAVSSNATYYPLFVAASANGNQAADLGTGLTFNPSTNVLTTTTFSGALSGAASGNTLKSTGDIDQTSFAAANNQVAATDVTGLLFVNASVRSFEALVSVYINATSPLYEQFILRGIQKAASWEMSQTSVGDNSGIVFSITTLGQIQYTSPNSAGFVSNAVRFRAKVTSV